MKTTISTTIDAFIHKEAKDQDISWSDALEFGIKFLIAEKDGYDYPNCKLLNVKMANLQNLLSETMQENARLKEQLDHEKKISDCASNSRKQKGCGKKIQIGWNKVLNCPINNQCGMTSIGNELFLCEKCKSSTYNSHHLQVKEERKTLEQSEEIEKLKLSTPVVDAQKEAEDILKDLGVAKDE